MQVIGNRYMEPNLNSTEFIILRMKPTMRHDNTREVFFSQTAVRPAVYTSLRILPVRGLLLLVADLK